MHSPTFAAANDGIYLQTRPGGHKASEQTRTPASETASQRTGNVVGVVGSQTQDPATDALRDATLEAPGLNTHLVPGGQ
jgi:hypothetical protein